ncbi:MAG: hypothetical protein RBU27_08105 [Bacteroidota bacterium]|nr:hypothetical protein [Bacteroidota bacterium]
MARIVLSVDERTARAITRPDEAILVSPNMLWRASFNSGAAGMKSE